MQPAAVLAVIVKAQGVTGTNAQLATVQKTAEKADSKVTQLGNTMVASGKKMQSAGRTMTVGLTVPLVAAGYLAIKTAAKFERSMAQVKVAGNVGGKGMKSLERLALKMGAETIFSANEAAEAMLELVKTGISPAEVKAGALAATMHLAATEGLELGRTAEIVGASMNTFNLKASETGRIADALAGGAIASAASVEGLAESLAQGGQSAAMYGLSIEESVGALAAFAQNGIQASDAGTSFKTFMMRLNPVQKKQKELMNELNLSFFNQHGHLVGLTEVSKRLRGALGEMTQEQRNQALQTIFGSDAQRAANIVFREGPKGMAKYIKATEKRGTAEKMANAQMKGMPGAIEKMSGSLETAALVAGEAMAPAVLAVAGTVEHLANAFSALPPEMQTTIVVIAAVVAALGPLVFIMGTLIKNGGYVVQAIGWIVSSLSTETSATQAATAANAEFAASLQAAAVAQRELLVANSSGRVTGAVPVSSPTGPPIIPPAAGQSAATSFAAKFARFLGPALAVVGIGMIISSAISGDMKKAGFQAGGAIAGGIAGFLLGGPFGAMIGVGLGSIIGGALSKLFESGKALHPLQEKLTAQSKTAAKAWEQQRKAIHNLHGAEDRLSGAHKRTKETSARATAANKHLNAVVEKYGPVSRQAHRAELALARARRENAHAANSEKHAEQMSENQRKLTLLRSREVVAHEKARIPTLQQTIKQLTVRSNKDKNNVPLLERLVKAENQLSQSTNKVHRAIKDVAAISPKQAESLRRMNSVQAEFGEHLKGLSRIYRTHKAEATRSIANIGGAWIDARGTIHQSTSAAKGDIHSFTVATTKGTEATKKQLYEFAAELGIRNVHFGNSSKGKPPGKQTGGMVVPGSGPGDKVPLTAMVEPGEIIHVLNMKASKDRAKLAALEHMNSAIPRRATGGTLGSMHHYAGLSGDTDFYPEMGFALSKMAQGTGTHINVASGYRSMAEQAVLYAAYLAGTGNLAAKPSPNAPHVKGYAADIAPGRGTFGNVASKFGLGFTVPSEEWHIELLNAALGARGAFAGTTPKMTAQMLTGPDGLLKTIGQASMTQATSMAQKYLNQHVGTGGMGSVPTGPVVQMAKEMVSNIWGMGQWGAFNALEMSEAGWDPGIANPSSGAAGLAQALPPSKYPPGAWPYEGLESAKLQLEWMMGYIKERYGTPSQAWAFHQANNYYAKGGTIPGTPEAFQTPVSLSKTIASSLHGIASGKHLPKYQASLKRAKRRIEGIGLGQQRIEALGDASKAVEKYSEYATNASSMTLTDEEGNTIQGLFKGRSEGSWLNEQLSSLIRLRSMVIGAHESIGGTQLPRVDKLFKDAKKRLIHVQRMIREAEAKKRAIEKKIKEVEQLNQKGKQKLESELKELERQLNKAQGAKTPNHDQINAIRTQIAARKDAMSGGGHATQNQVKALHEEAQKIDRENKGRKRVEGALSGSIIPALEGRKTGMLETMTSLFGDGGQTGVSSFLGLKQIQGAGGTTGAIGNPPVLGELGGEIFTVQNRLREIQEEAKRTKLGSEDSELQDITKELELDWKKRYLVSEAQRIAMTSFPTVQKLTTLPFAGSFASGGIMAAEVGERGREIVVGPQGSRVIPSHEVNAALSGSSENDTPPELVFEELNVYTDEGRVTGRFKGRDFDATVRNVKFRGPRTPGGR